MIGRLALRDRLAASFALALVVAYGLIAVCAVVVVDRAVTSAIDGRLSTVAAAILTIAGDDRDEIDRKDRQQFASIVTDASGAYVVATDGSVLLGTSDLIAPWVRTAIRAQHTGRIFSAQQDRRPIRALVLRRHAHHETNIVIVWQSMQIVADVERIVVLVLGGFGIVVAAGGYAIGAQIARNGLLPLTRITAIVADIAAHDLSRRVGPQPNADELGRLAATFDKMLDRLESAFERQRQFTADASHDLRAPLATLRAEVDLALRRERTAGEYRAALQEIAIDASHLEQLIDALLAVARTDGEDIAIAPIDLNAIVQTSVNEIAPFAQAKNVVLDADLSGGTAILGDFDLLERAVLATLHNAVNYTPPGSSIYVRVGTAANGVHVTIQDEGPGFSDLALNHAFDRFWRDDSARGRSGTGLGLAIAQGIVQRCGGKIAIDNAPAGGGRVTVSFPALSSRELNEQPA